MVIKRIIVSPTYLAACRRFATSFLSNGYGDRFVEECDRQSSKIVGWASGGMSRELRRGAGSILGKGQFAPVSNDEHCFVLVARGGFMPFGDAYRAWSEVRHLTFPNGGWLLMIGADGDWFYSESEEEPPRFRIFGRLRA